MCCNPFFQKRMKKKKPIKNKPTNKNKNRKRKKITLDLTKNKCGLNLPKAHLSFWESASP